MIQEVMSGKRKRSSAPTLQASPQALLKVLDDKAPIEDALKLKFKAIFDRYENLVKLSSTQITATRFKINNNSVFDPAPEFLRAPGVEHVRTFSPLELIGTAILVSSHMDKRTDQELLEDVKAMRFYLRVKHKDLRVNAQCWVTVWEFVTEEMARRKAVKNGHIIGRPLPASGHPVNGVPARAAQYASPYAPLVSIAPMGGMPIVGAPGGSANPLDPVPGPGPGPEVASTSVNTPKAASPGIVNGSFSAGEAPSRLLAPALHTEDASAQEKASQPTAAAASKATSGNGAKGAQTNGVTATVPTSKSSNPNTKAMDEEATVTSENANSKPELAGESVKDEEETKPSTNTPPKRPTRASKSTSSPDGVKAEDETKQNNVSPPKRSNPLKAASPPSKRLKQKA
jgi:hypothetical protein